MGKLSATGVKALKEPGRYGDGGGLYLFIKKSGSRSWMLRVQKGQKRRDFGLGSFETVTLAQAREKARKVRAEVEAGLDPVIERKGQPAVPTLREAALKVWQEQSPAWRNRKHSAQWLASLETYAFPSIGDVGVDKLEPGQVRDVLASIWLSKRETAKRVRQRLFQIIDWAVGKGYRDAALPHAVINRALPKDTRTESHFEALPFDQVPGFMAALRAKPETPARLALELLILTASRSGEVRLALWSEIDWERRLWTRPASHMKAKREHAVPLSEAAVAVLERARALGGERQGLIFEGQSRDKPLSDMTLTKRLRDMKLSATVHGFRSSFRDWVSEKTDFDGAVAESALAHQVKNAVEAAYRRGALLEKRRLLMAAWATYCDSNA
jgi:integrase